MPKKLRCLLLVILCGLQINCATPPDVPACQNLQQHLSTDPVTAHLILAPSPTCMKQIGEVECGHCVYIVSGKEVFIGEGKEHLLDGKTWSTLKQQAVILPAKESYAPLSAYLINSCKQANCNDQIDRFKIKLDLLNGSP